MGDNHRSFQHLNARILLHHPGPVGLGVIYAAGPRADRLEARTPARVANPAGDALGFMGL